MTKIPSIEMTEDFIYRIEIERGTPLHDPSDPHLLAFEQFIDPAGPFHSIDVTTLRDKQRATDIQFRSFAHMRESNMAHVKLIFFDSAYRVSEHTYLLTVVLRYLITPTSD